MDNPLEASEVARLLRESVLLRNINAKRQKLQAAEVKLQAAAIDVQAAEINVQAAKNELIEFNKACLYEKQRQRVSSKNSLESYAFNMKLTIEDNKLKDKISEGDRIKILDACQDAIRWLDGNQMAEKEEFDHKLKEVEGVCSRIITKLYQSSGGGPDGFPGGASVGEQHTASGGDGGRGPTIEEVD